MERIESATFCAASTILTIVRRWEESGYVPWWHRWRDTTRNMPNSVMLTLVSTTQGLHKSTFSQKPITQRVKRLLHGWLLAQPEGKCTRKIVEFAYHQRRWAGQGESEEDAADEDHMMQTMKPSFIGAYKKNFNRLPRSASFTGHQQPAWTSHRPLWFPKIPDSGTRRDDQREWYRARPDLRPTIRWGRAWRTLLLLQGGWKGDAGTQSALLHQDGPGKNRSSYFRTPRRRGKGEKMTANIILKKLSNDARQGVFRISPESLQQDHWPTFSANRNIPVTAISIL